jgi:isoleucyl-tRNA synthetase
VAEPDIIRHVADIFEKESSDAWFIREATELLPAGYSCKKCGAAEWTKETDILDVWFDSGSSSVAVLESRPELQWPADVYLEGGDQFRGWFNSSLMVGIAAHDRAPYKTVITHGWTVDAQGKEMHKSGGNAVPPDEVIKDSGADILRLWCASSNYFDDMRSSKEILDRVSDGYRKLRNTARFALGNLHGFDPARDSVADAEMLETDRWALAKLDEVVRTVRDAYEAYEFHTVYHTLYNFCTVTLSARYFDILKDRLYTFSPRNPARRSAQTAVYRIADALARMLAPLIAFTADEIWENLPPEDTRPTFVHAALLPEASGPVEESLLANWERLFEIRDDVLQSLEEARVAKQIGSSLEARLEIAAAGESYDLLVRYRNELRYVFIVSQVEVMRSDEGAAGVVVKVLPAEGAKCERCWNYSTRVGESVHYPTVCERCVVALDELESEAKLNGA